MKEIRVGCFITLMLLFLLSYYFTYDEIKAFWWIYISLLAIAALFTTTTTTYNLTLFIIGAILADCIIGAITLFLQNNLFDALFITVHHCIWAYMFFLLYLNSNIREIKWALLGQLAISSLDVNAGIFKLVDKIKKIRKKDIEPICSNINLYGRLLLGNVCIFMASTTASTSTALPFVGAACFNTCVGSVLAFSDDLLQYYDY
jgi:hypothetical protein